MNAFKKMRPSNLVLLAAAPFIIYLFATSTNYQRSLSAIIGIEDNAPNLLIGFSCLAVLFISGLLLPFRVLAKKTASGIWHTIGKYSPIVHLVLLAILIFIPTLVEPFVHSIIANAVDPYTSDLIAKTVQPRQLTPEAASQVTTIWTRLLQVYVAIAIILGLLSYKISGKTRHHILISLLTINACGLLFILLAAHIGFASGLFITLRAALFAYIAAAILGLCWAGMQGLKNSQHTLRNFTIISALFLAGAAYFFAQPNQTYVLIGSLDERVAIIKGTPQALSDIIRYGEYEGATDTQVDIRSAKDVEQALHLLENAKNVTGAFIPVELKPAHVPQLWEISFLPNTDKVPALSLLIIGALLVIATFGGWRHNLHPLAVISELFIDTIRGIPMLVIILYVGLPLSGAVKDASGGAIDLSNMTRGIIAISIGYSAYMAEIFRAGIEAVPRGQIEAAQSLGLSRWQVARLVILPQALRVVIPPLGNEFIAMLKDTSLLSILSVRDVTQRMREFQASSFLPFAPFNTAAILYVVLTLASASVLKWIERRYENKTH